MKVEIGQVVSQIICFLLMFWILKRYAWKPLLGVIEERKLRIKAEFDQLEDQKKSLNNLMQEYRVKLEEVEERALFKMQEAIKEGKDKALKIQENAHEKAKNIILKVQEDLHTEINKAKIQMKEEMIKLTLMATEKLLDENIDTEKNTQLISKLLDSAGAK